MDHGLGLYTGKNTCGVLCRPSHYPKSLGAVPFLLFFLTNHTYGVGPNNGDFLPVCQCKGLKVGLLHKRHGEGCTNAILPILHLLPLCSNSLFRVNLKLAWVSPHCKVEADIKFTLS